MIASPSMQQHFSHRQCWEAQPMYLSVSATARRISQPQNHLILNNNIKSIVLACLSCVLNAGFHSGIFLLSRLISNSHPDHRVYIIFKRYIIWRGNRCISLQVPVGSKLHFHRLHHRGRAGFRFHQRHA